jgi:DNA-dependent metalloprotease WSS1
MPLDEARRLARVAAEQRRTLSAGSGRRLGGAPISRGTDMRKFIADAAQRRIAVTNGCASGSSEGERLLEEASRNSFKTKAEEDNANEQAIMQAYIEMIQEEEREKYGQSYIPPSQENPAGPRSTFSSPPIRIPENSRHTSPSPPSGHDVDQRVHDSSSDKPWSCPICTLKNPPNFLCCDACAAERPLPSKLEPNHNPVIRTSDNRVSKPISRLVTQASKPKAFKPRSSAAETIAALKRNTPEKPLGWTCHVCGTFMETEWWTCSLCGKMKQVS